MVWADKKAKKYPTPTPLQTFLGGHEHRLPSAFSLVEKNAKNSVVRYEKSSRTGVGQGDTWIKGRKTQGHFRNLFGNKIVTVVLLWFPYLLFQKKSIRLAKN
ncbi:MAG: hypothetical protein ACKVU2_16215 [Saprospiraceae bacterium]